MFFQYDTALIEEQTAEEESQWWAEQLETYLAPYRERLDAYLDRRVVGNLTAVVAGIVQTRVPLTTSELGSTICGPAHAEAGTQRVQRALHHQGWQAEVIEALLWEEAERRRQELERQGETPLCIWDSSVLEKPESEKLEGLGAVRSSRVRRLARSRKGVFNRPSGMPVSVRGFEWESLLLVGKQGKPQVVAMSWWGREKGVEGQQRQHQERLLARVARQWGQTVRHVFDRGYGTGPWLSRLSHFRVRFVVRWKKGNKLIDAAGEERKAWQIATSANAPGERRPRGSGTRIVGSIAARGCWPCPFVILSMRGPCGWWSCAKAKDANPGICSPMSRWRPRSKPGTWPSPMSRVGKLRNSSVFRKPNCSSSPYVCVTGSRAASCSCSSHWPTAFSSGCCPLACCWPVLACWFDFEPRADWRQWNAKLPLYRLRWALSRLWLTHPPSFPASGWRPYLPLSHLTWPPCSLRWWMTLWHQSGYLF